MQIFVTDLINNPVWSFNYSKTEIKKIGAKRRKTRVGVLSASTRARDGRTSPFIFMLKQPAVVNVLLLGEAPRNSDYWFTRFRSYEEKPILLEKADRPQSRRRECAHREREIEEVNPIRSTYSSSVATLLLRTFSTVTSSAVPSYLTSTARPPFTNPSIRSAWSTSEI